MRILLSNDDGINAHGLKILEKIARALSDDVWIVAPELDQSGASHSLTLRNPIRIREVSERKYAVTGTPTDCISAAVYHLMKNSPPQLVLSGVNQGGNIAEDVTYSGTIAAAIEATLLGIPAVSMSLVSMKDHAPKWAAAEHYGIEILKKLVMQTIPSNVFVNVNFPDVITSSVKGIKITTQGHRQIEDNLIECMDPRGKPYYWIGPGNHRYCDSPVAPPPGTDLEAITQGYVSITPLSLNLTHTPTLHTLEGVFSE